MSYPEDLSKWPDMYEYREALTRVTFFLTDGDAWVFYARHLQAEYICKQMGQDLPEMEGGPVSTTVSFSAYPNANASTTLEPEERYQIKKELIKAVRYQEQNSEGAFYGLWEDPENAKPYIGASMP